MNNTTGATCGVGTAYLSGVPEFTSGFSEVRLAQSLGTQVLRKGKQFLLHMWHPSCYSCQSSVIDYNFRYIKITWYKSGAIVYNFRYAEIM
jgi:formate hydrogenlyase subunit 3/multisubunit Na+/H+ antiporter MnhD subunit